MLRREREEHGGGKGFIKNRVKRARTWNTEKESMAKIRCAGRGAKIDSSTTRKEKGTVKCLTQFASEEGGKL